MSWGGKRERPPSQCAQASRYILLMSNTVAVLLGFTLVGLSIWLLLDPALSEIREHLQLFTGYKAGLVVSITVAVGVCILSMFGFCVSWNSSSRGLITYSIVCLILIACQIAVMSLVFKYTAANKLGPFLSDAIREMIDRRKIPKRDAITFLDRIQEAYSCCGGSGVTDYTHNEMDLPWSCFYDEAFVHDRGCGPVLAEHFKANGLAVGLFALGLLFLQVVLCVCAWAQFFDKRVVRTRLAASTV